MRRPCARLRGSRHRRGAELPAAGVRRGTRTALYSRLHRHRHRGVPRGDGVLRCVHEPVSLRTSGLAVASCVGFKDALEVGPRPHRTQDCLVSRCQWLRAVSWLDARLPSNARWVPVLEAPCCWGARRSSVGLDTGPRLQRRFLRLLQRRRLHAGGGRTLRTVGCVQLPRRGVCNGPSLRRGGQSPGRRSLRFP